MIERYLKSRAVHIKANKYSLLRKHVTLRKYKMDIYKSHVSY